MKKLNFFQNKPKAEKIDVEAYLSRINITKKAPSLQYLKELQKSHLLHVPFENLDIHYGNKIILNYQKVFNKVILNKRGGFCYELNGLFYHLLYHLGFDCFIISAQVFSEQRGAYGKPFDHMAIIVELDGDQWLVDVGLGDSPISPLRIKVGEVQMDYTRYWRLENDADENMLLKLSTDTTSFENRTLFTTDERQLIQFMEMCDYHQHSPDSMFTQKKLITKLTGTGRVTLTDRNLIINELGEKSEFPIMNEDEFLSKLEHHFGITFQQLTYLNT